MRHERQHLRVAEGSLEANDIDVVVLGHHDVAHSGEAFESRLNSRRRNVVGQRGRRRRRGDDAASGRRRPGDPGRTGIGETGAGSAEVDVFGASQIAAVHAVARGDGQAGPGQAHAAVVSCHRRDF